MNKNIIPIVIPSYEPDERFITLLNELVEKNIGPIIVVNDGSGEIYAPYFKKAGEIIGRIGGEVLSHSQNMGKGRALKTAFSFIINKYDALGCVTADSDGQHTPICISKIKKCLIENPNNLILGVRDFDAPGVPIKSKHGNKITVKALKFFTGISVSDTQTGLRGIPIEFMKKLLNVRGERFEFETEMLIYSKDSFPIKEVPIETVYDSKENHTTHFNPIKDSIKIYKIFGRIFSKFLISSLSSSIIDILLFALFCRIYKSHFKMSEYIFISTISARVISAIYNFIINYIFVFKSKESKAMAFIKYTILAIIQMLLSATLVTLICYLVGDTYKVLIKIIVDIILFCISYYIQQMIVYRGRNKKR